MYRDMDQWIEIRRKVLVKGVSKRQILRQSGMHWKTLQKILTHSSPPGYQRTKPIEKPKIGPFLERIKQILQADREVPPKRIFERLRAEGFEGGYTIVKDAVRQLKAHSKEVFMPLRAHSRDAIAQFLLPVEPWEQSTFSLQGREHLRRVKVAQTDIRTSIINKNNLPFIIYKSFVHIGRQPMNSALDKSFFIID